MKEVRQENREKETVEKIHHVSAEVKQKMKSEYGDNLKSILLPLDDYNVEFKEVLGVVPNRKVVGQFMRFSKENPLKANEILVKNCLLTSKEEVMSDDGLFYAAVIALSELIPIREGKFGKL